MNTVLEKEDLKNIFIQNFHEFEKEIGINQQSPIHEIRKKALEAFKKLDFPTTKHEEWKYTNLASLLKSDLDFHYKGFANSLPSVSKEDIKINMPEANTLIFIDGHYIPELSRIPTYVHEATILSFATAEEKKVEALDTHFAKHTDHEKSFFTALNTAFAQNGAFVQVFQDNKLAIPIVLLFITTGNVVVQPRNIIIGDKNSEFNIIECHYNLSNQPSFTNSVTEIFLEEGAKIQHYKLQQKNENAFLIATTQVHQESNSQFSDFTITLDGRIVRNNLQVVSDGENCETNMYGLYMLKGNSHVDNHTLVDHKKPNSYSNELYNGILDEKSVGVFNGKIYVRRDAQKTNAFQSNRNILLCDDATINTKPQLEIWADDVKCSHGATSGQIDKDAVFYLRARGLSEETARALITWAFAGEAVEKIGLEDLKNHVTQLLAERLKINL